MSQCGLSLFLINEHDDDDDDELYSTSYIQSLCHGPLLPAKFRIGVVVKR